MHTHTPPASLTLRHLRARRILRAVIACAIFAGFGIFGLLSGGAAYVLATYGTTSAAHDAGLILAFTAFICIPSAFYFTHLYLSRR